MIPRIYYLAGCRAGADLEAVPWAEYTNNLARCTEVASNEKLPSSGITEAEIYGIPVINIGTRQNNRSKNKNIIHVVSENKKILSAINKIHGKKFKPVHGFGTGKSASKFIEILLNSKTWNTSIQKKFIDIK